MASRLLMCGKEFLASSIRHLVQENIHDLKLLVFVQVFEVEQSGEVGAGAFLDETCVFSRLPYCNLACIDLI